MSNILSTLTTFINAWCVNNKCYVLIKCWSKGDHLSPVFTLYTYNNRPDLGHHGIIIHQKCARTEPMLPVPGPFWTYSDPYDMFTGTVRALPYSTYRKTSNIRRTSVDEKHLNLGIWCALYERFHGIFLIRSWIAISHPWRSSYYGHYNIYGALCNVIVSIVY